MNLVLRPGMDSLSMQLEYCQLMFFPFRFDLFYFTTGLSHVDNGVSSLCYWKNNYPWNTIVQFCINLVNFIWKECNIRKWNAHQGKKIALQKNYWRKGVSWMKYVLPVWMNGHSVSVGSIRELPINQPLKTIHSIGTLHLEKHWDGYAVVEFWDGRES